MRKSGFKFISIVIIIAMVLSIAGCGDDSETKVITKKKVIDRYHEAESSSDESTSSEDSASGSGDDYISTPSGGSDSSDDTSSDNSSESLPLYEVDLDGKGYSDADARIGMGLYHYYLGDWNETFGDIYGEEMSFMNTSFGDADSAALAKENNSVVWIGPGDAFDDRNTLVFKDGFEEQLEMTVQAYKNAGLWDSVAGFHFDEPCLKYTGEQFKVLTKYLAETYPNKRIFPVVSVYEIRDNAPAGTFVGEMSYENYGYVTDIGFDWYGTADIDEHRTLLNEMKEKIGRSDVRIWFFPCTSKIYADQDEDYMIEHLNMCYELLKEQENPGGLMLYTWTTYGTMTGLQELLDPDLGYKYERLAARIVEIGKEINSNPYRYNKSKN